MPEMTSLEVSRSSWGNNCLGMWLFASQGTGWEFRIPIPLWTQCLLPLCRSSKRTSLLSTDTSGWHRRDGLGQCPQNVFLGPLLLNQLGYLLQTRFILSQTTWIKISMGVYFKEVIFFCMQILGTFGLWVQLNGKSWCFLFVFIIFILLAPIVYS